MQNFSSLWVLYFSSALGRLGWLMELEFTVFLMYSPFLGSRCPLQGVFPSECFELLLLE